MALPLSHELEVVLRESRDVARRLDQTLTSAHLLLCLFTLKNRASMFLSDHQVTADRLLDALKSRPKEEQETWDRMLRRAGDVAQMSNAAHVSSLHVLVALCSFVDSAAYKLVAALDLDMGTVRSTALAYLTSADDHGEAWSETGLRATDVAAESARGAHQSASAAPLVARPPALATPRRGAPGAPPADADAATAPPAPSAAPPRSGATHRAAEGPAARRASRSSAMSGGVRGARGASRSPLERSASASVSEAQSREEARAPDATRSLATRLFGNATPATRAASLVSPSDLPLPPSVRRGGRAKPSAPARERATERSVSRHTLLLREKQYPLLSKLGRNLTLLAYDGGLDPVVGRESEIDQLIDILNKRRSNNPVLVGEAGVGKTAVVEGLARRLVGCDGPPPAGLAGRILVELEASKIVSGTSTRGSFSERIQQLKKEVARAQGNIVLFLDELHHWIGAGGGGDGAADGAGELKTALARGEFPCIGATTFDEYRTFIESDPAFARRFQMVRVVEPPPERAIEILRGIKERYEHHHEVSFDDDAIDAAVRLTHRYLPDRRLPDKAIGVLDLAGSRARRIGAQRVARPLIATLVGELAGLSADKLLMADRERFLDLEKRLMRHIIGHQHVIERVSHTLRRNYAGFVSGRPIGSFLFLGSTGVGKTEFAKALARVLFDDPSAMVRIDMSELLEAHSVARLIGSPPGYVGHDAGGQLTEAVLRRPYQLVLLDEIEKAHPDVLNLLIQLLDEGHLSDSRGRTVDFSNTVVVLTSNLGADAVDAPAQRAVGFGVEKGSVNPRAALAERVLDAAKPHLRPELWNRLDDALVFEPLTRDEVARIARLQLTHSSKRLREERGIGYSCAPEVVDLLIDSGGYDPAMGARPMRRTIERLVESAIADRILAGDVVGPCELLVSVEDGQIAVATVG